MPRFSDPYAAAESRYECTDCGERAVLDEQPLVCADCGGDVRNITVPRN